MMVTVCRMVNAVRLTSRDMLPLPDHALILPMGERFVAV
jgi:hypothetical protein